MPNYPPANDYRKSAKTYGSLPSHGFTQVALVLHTTETSGMPGFQDGATAPHYVYRPQTGEWEMWAEYEDGYVGTLKGHSTGHYNCKAFQVEILGYSDSNHSPWVGDFTEDNYIDLALFYRWAIERYGIGAVVTSAPDGGWRYGTNSPYRMTDDEWATFTGLTAHGAVPNNTHWDTGVLDLDLIHALATDDSGEDMFTHYKIGQEYAEWEDISWLLFQLRGGTVNPNENSSQVSSHLPYKTNVKLVQVEDFDLIADFTSMSAPTAADFKADGMYRWGKEQAALKQYAWRDST